MTTQYEFDKGVDIPTASSRTGVNVDLLRAMPAGTSKWFSTKEVKRATRFYRVAKKLGIVILIRKVGKEDPRGAGVRMWRTDATRDAAHDPIAAAERKAVKRPAKKAAKKPVPKAKKKAAKPKRRAKKTNSAEAAAAA
jgi:hypothetical protein